MKLNGTELKMPRAGPALVLVRRESGGDLTHEVYHPRSEHEPLKLNSGERSSFPMGAAGDEEIFLVLPGENGAPATIFTLDGEPQQAAKLEGTSEQQLELWNDND